jgi:hypothetical protein
VGKGDLQVGARIFPLWNAGMMKKAGVEVKERIHSINVAIKDGD